MSKRYNIHGEKVKSKTIKDWASNEGAVIRSMAMHSLLSARRSIGARQDSHAVLSMVENTACGTRFMQRNGGSCNQAGEDSGA